MSSTSIRINEQALAILQELARKQDRSLQAVLKEAIESYRRQKFLEDANAAFAALRCDAESWREELEERARWDRSGMDGLVEDE